MIRVLKMRKEGEGILEGQHSQDRGLRVWMCWGVVVLMAQVRSVTAECEEGCLAGDVAGILSGKPRTGQGRALKREDPMFGYGEKLLGWRVA